MFAGFQRFGRREKPKTILRPREWNFIGEHRSCFHRLHRRCRLHRRAVRLFRRSAAARLRPRPCRHKGDGREAGRGDLRIWHPGKRHRVPGRLLPGLTQILHMPDAEHFALRRKFTLLKTEKLPFTFGNNMCILVCEQSRISRVKCCQNGELCDRRRTCVRDGISAPAAP